MSRRTMKACGREVPHGEHSWYREDDGSQARCPGRDTGDTTGLNAKPCGSTRPHPFHLWDDLGSVRRCFGALGLDPVRARSESTTIRGNVFRQPDFEWRNSE